MKTKKIFLKVTVTFIGENMSTKCLQKRFNAYKKNSKILFSMEKKDLWWQTDMKNIEKNMSFDGKTIKSSNTIQLLGITLDKNLNFNDIYKIFVAKQIIKPKIFYVYENS